jgi:hypothetical protein
MFQGALTGCRLVSKPLKLLAEILVDTLFAALFTPLVAVLLISKSLKLLAAILVDTLFAAPISVSLCRQPHGQEVLCKYV